MKIVEYDAETYAILVKKRQLEGAGFLPGEEAYVITLEKGMLAIIRKSSFKERLRETVKSSMLKSDVKSTEGHVHLSDQEMALLAKVSSIKFEERIPEKILSSLTKEEAATLASLVDKGILNIYKGGKYSGKGVYTISRDIYNMVRERAGVAAKEEPTDERQQEITKIDDVIKSLNRNGFLVVENDETAKNLSYMLRDKIKSGSIKGIRGFDSKYYIFTSKKYDEVYNKVEKYLRENKRSTLSEISKNIGIDEQLCKGVLTFMLENSDIIEKSRGRYELI